MTFDTWIHLLELLIVAVIVGVTLFVAKRARSG